MIIFGLEHAVRPTQRSPFWIVTVRSILVFFDRFCHCYHSFITTSNITSSDSDATISYGSESHFDGLTIEEFGRTRWPPTAAVGKATASTSGTRRVVSPERTQTLTQMIITLNYLVRHRTRCGYIHVYMCDLIKVLLLVMKAHTCNIAHINND